MALFGEKYGDRVRVIKLETSPPNFAAHAHRATEKWPDKVLKEGSVSSGVRRIEAVTGRLLRHFRQDHQLGERRSQLRRPTLRKKRERMAPNEEVPGLPPRL